MFLNVNQMSSPFMLNKKKKERKEKEKKEKKKKQLFSSATF